MEPRRNSEDLRSSARVLRKKPVSPSISLALAERKEEEMDRLEEGLRAPNLAYCPRCKTKIGMKMFFGDDFLTFCRIFSGL